MGEALLAPSRESFDVGRFTSPRRVIMRSLLNSRERWKAKAVERLEELKALQKKAARLEDSRRHWQNKAQQAEHGLRELPSQAERPQRANGETLDEEQEASVKVAIPQKKQPPSS